MPFRRSKYKIRRTVNKRILQRVVNRIVEVADPDKIILFGSAARGEMNGNSDLDLLVVKSGIHRRRLTQAIYRNMLGVGVSTDIIVVTPEDIEQYSEAIGLILEPALREGRIVYEHKTIPTR